jgi:hypothetical protein
MARMVFVLPLLLALIAVPLISAQEGDGSVLSGQVLDSISRGPVAGAIVEFSEKSLKTQSDRDGSFRLTQIPSGSRMIHVRSLGYNDYETVVDIRPGAQNVLTIELIPVFRESVDVEVPILEGQAKALNQQKNSINIKNIVAADQSDVSRIQMPPKRHNGCRE